MRAALAAGVDPRGTAAPVRIVQQPELQDKAAAAEQAAKQVAALRLLAAHGGLDSPVAECTLTLALRHRCEPCVIEYLRMAGSGRKCYAFLHVVPTVPACCLPPAQSST